jgi:hypothetical protein
MVAALLERPGMRALRLHECWHDAIIDLESAYLKNDREAIPMILANVKEFLALSTRGGQDSETNNAISTAAAAIVGTQLDMQGKKAAVGRLLGLTLARATEAIQQRKQTKATMHAQAGCPGSSLDNVYTMEPASVRADAADADRGFIRHANRPCPCDQCLQGNNSACTVKRLFVNAVGKSEIERRTGMAARAATRSKVTGAWVGGVVDGTIVAVRVHSDEPNDHDEPYFLAVVTRDVDDVGVNAHQLKWRNNKTQIVGTNVVNKNVGCCGFGGFTSAPVHNRPTPLQTVGSHRLVATCLRPLRRLWWSLRAQ